MKQPLLLSAGCIPALILLAVVFIDRWRRKQRGERQPLSEKLLRPAGYSLQCRLEDVNDSFNGWFMGAFLFSLLVAIFPQTRPGDVWVWLMSFLKRKRSEVIVRIRSRGNKDTELALARLLRAHGIAGWRRQFEIRGRAVLPRGSRNQAAQQRRPTNNQRTARPFVIKAMQGRRSVPAFHVKPDFDR